MIQEIIPDNELTEVHDDKTPVECSSEPEIETEHFEPVRRDC